jgi:hypothetical protein
LAALDKTQTVISSDDGVMTIMLVDQTGNRRGMRLQTQCYASLVFERSYFKRGREPAGHHSFA